MENLIHDERPLHIYFGKSFEENEQTNNDANEVISLLECRVKWCTSFIELSSAVYEQPKNIVVHIDVIKRNNGTISEFMLMLDTLIKYADITRPNIGVVIEKDTDIATIKELRKYKIQGIVPSVESFDNNECVKAINSLLNDLQYWPKSIIESLPGNEIKTKKNNYKNI